MDQLEMGEVNLSGGGTSTAMQDSQASEELTENISALRTRVTEMEGILAQKLKELKEICLKEAALTGRLPKEYPLLPGESAPRVRQRVGAAYKLDDIFSHEDPYLRNLECRLALQHKIVEAAENLAAEAKGCKTLKKLRKKSCVDAMEKLRKIEEEINQYRIAIEEAPRQTPSPVKDDICVKEQRPEGMLEGHSKNHLEQASFRKYMLNSYSNHHHNKHFNRPSYSDTSEALENRPRGALDLTRSPFKTPAGKSQHMCGISGANLTGLSSIYQTCCRAQLRLEGNDQFAWCNRRQKSNCDFLNQNDLKDRLIFSSEGLVGLSNDAPDNSLSPISQSNLDLSNMNCKGNLLTQRPWCPRKGQIYTSSGSTPNLGYSLACIHSHQALPQNPPIVHCIIGCSSCFNPQFQPHEIPESDGNPQDIFNPSYQTVAYSKHLPHGHSEHEGMNRLLQNYNTVRSSCPRRFSGPKIENVSRSIQRTLVLEHLQGWYHQSLERLNQTHGFQTASNYSKEYKHILGYQTLPAQRRHSKKVTSNCPVPSATSVERCQDHVITGQMEQITPLSVHQPCPGSYFAISSSSPASSK
ncbi:FERM domain-containing protein 4B-like [Scleropages formosus]|nr:FERM domain-containing protein 4B-like [Scleropages formosus]